MNIATLDWIVIAFYFVVITAIGLVAGYRVRRTPEYFLGGRRFGPWLMIGQSFGVGTHAEMPVALAGAVYSVGASAIWFQWKNLFVTPFYWMMAPIFRRIRRTTMAEFTVDRYGSWMAVIYSVFAICYFIINTGTMLKGAAKVISQATGGERGRQRDRRGDDGDVHSLQLRRRSGRGRMDRSISGRLDHRVVVHADSARLGSGRRPRWDEGVPRAVPFLAGDACRIGPWVIAMLTINGLVGIMAQPHMLATVGTGRDERTCRIGMFYGNFVKRVCTVGWALVGLIVAAMIAQGRGDATALADPENAFGFACRQLLFPGALGLMIAAVLAA